MIVDLCIVTTGMLLVLGTGAFLHLSDATSSYESQTTQYSVETDNTDRRQISIQSSASRTFHGTQNRAISLRSNHTIL